ncbi:MAG: hypothetical protein ACKOQP_05170 [Bacteroidota bacterium]
MSARTPTLPSWRPESNICDLLMVLPTAGAELERLGVPLPAVTDCLTVEQVAQSIGWDPFALLNFLVKGKSGSLEAVHPGMDIEIPRLIESLRADHADLLGQGVRQIRQILESESCFEDLGDDFQVLAAEIACHFLLEEEEWFPYLQVLNRGIAGELSHTACLEAMQNHALTEDLEVDVLFQMFQHMMNKARILLQEDPSSESKGRLVNEMQAFGRAWMAHEDREAQELFPRIVALENRLLSLN